MQENPLDQVALDKLRTAFRTALALPDSTDVDIARYGETAGWDSVAHMAIIAELESAFDIMLDADEVVGMSSFDEAARTIRNHALQSGS